jgi:hypothetical protein
MRGTHHFLTAFASTPLKPDKTGIFRRFAPHAARKSAPAATWHAPCEDICGMEVAVVASSGDVDCGDDVTGYDAMGFCTY